MLIEQTNGLAATPEERVKLIMALTATIRWKGSYTDDYTGDDENMAIISGLIDKLARLQYDTIKSLLPN